MIPEPLVPRPLTKEDLIDYTNYLPIADSVLDLQADVLNVTQGRVDIESFPLEYQDKLRAYYQFSATRLNTDANKIAKRTIDTLDIV